MSILDRRSTVPPVESVSAQRFNTPRPLTASAARVDLKNKKEVDAIQKRRQTDKWQDEAWEYFDLVGEVKYSANLVANVTSRVTLYPGYVTDSTTIPSPITDKDIGLDNDEFKKDAQGIINLLESGTGGIAGLLRSAALNLFLVGECYLVYEPARFSTKETMKYQIRSTNEITAVQGRNSSVVIKPRRDSKPADYIPLPDGGYICRMWRNHPRYSDEADSSMRGVLDICDELLLISRMASATAKSRLNGGLLFVPDGLSNVTQSEGDVDDEMGGMSDDMGDSFEEELIDAMTTPISDVSSASAVVPLVVRGPEDLGAKISLIKFERAFDPQLANRHDKLIERILAGLDIPKDVAAGMSNVKYANAVVIEEQLYKAHIEPLILMIVDCLTIGFLRPALRAQGYPEELVSRAVVWYDPSNINSKPSKAEAAVTLYNLNAVSLETLRRAHGFSEADAPSDLERLQKVIEARGIISDGNTELLFNTMIPKDLQEQARQSALANSDPASANALTNALGGAPADAGAPDDPTAAPTADPAAGAPAPAAPPTLMDPSADTTSGTAPEAPAESDTIDSEQSKKQAPPTLMEP